MVRLPRLLTAVLVVPLLTLAAACVTAVPAEAAPTEFQLRDMQANGGVYDSNAHLGRPMVIEFYFAGCPACNTNAPKVHALVDQYYPALTQVVEVSIDEDRSDYDYWINKWNPITPVLDGSDRVLTRWFGVTAYPTTVVLDKQHNMIYKTVGVWSSATERRIKNLIEQNQ